eukprot:5389264-Pyramimonas_sp.AAC.1
MEYDPILVFFLDTPLCSNVGSDPRPRSGIRINQNQGRTAILGNFPHPLPELIFRSLTAPGVWRMGHSHNPRKKRSFYFYGQDPRAPEQHPELIFLEE